MASEELIVILDARTQELDAKLKSTNSKLDSLGNKTKSADSSLGGMSKTSKTSSISLGKVALAATAAATAATALIASTVKYAKEVQVAARRNGESVEKMQQWAFAADTVGISLEKLGDIGKDTNEKIGEFLATGGGGFQDFADVMGLTKTEATNLAKEFETMSGTDVLQEMVTRMEEAGISSNQMSFALEGLASDTTDLIPLLKDEGKVLKSLTADFDSLGAALSQDDINKITAVGVEFDKMKTKLGGESKQLVSDYAEEITRAIRVTTEFLTTTGNVFNLIATGWGNILEVSQAAVNDMVNGTDTLSGALQNRANISREALDTLVEDVKSGVENITSEFEVLDQELAKTGSTGEGTKEESPVIQKINSEVEAIRDRFKTELELLEEKLIKEKELIAQTVVDEIDRKALLLEVEKEFQDNKLAIETEAAEKKAEEEAKRKKEEEKEKKKLEKEKKSLQKIEDKIAKDNTKRDEQMASDSIALANFVFEDSKGVSAGIALVNTAEGVTKALATQNYAGAALTAAMGAAQISAILGASKGGGSIPSTSATAPTGEAQTAQADTSTLDITEQGDAGAQEIRLIITDESGNTYLDGLANGLEERARQGRG